MTVSSYVIAKELREPIIRLAQYLIWLYSMVSFYRKQMVKYIVSSIIQHTPDECIIWPFNRDLNILEARDVNKDTIITNKLRLFIMFNMGEENSISNIDVFADILKASNISILYVIRNGPMNAIIVNVVDKCVQRYSIKSLHDEDDPLLFGSVDL